MGDSGWEDSLKDAGLLDCCVAAAIGTEDSQLFAAVAHEEYPDPWAALYADDYTADVAQDDGSTAQESINEWTTITRVAGEGVIAPIYLAGEKFTYCNRDEQDEVIVVLAKKVKGGAVIAKTANGYYIIGVYDENKDQVPGKAIDALVNYAKTLAES